MSRVLRTVAWVLLFAACAGVGAFIASRTDPFPPGVDDPGARPTAAPSESSSPRWRASATVRTRHDLFVGGSCTTDWRVRLDAEGTNGREVRGEAVARLLPGAGCDTPTAQLQVESVDLAVDGRVRDGRLVLRLHPLERRPPGGIDLGGLLETLDRTVIRLPADGTGGAASFASTVPDTDRGSFVARWTIELRPVG